MTTLKLDSNNNLEVGRDFMLLSENEALIQDIKTRLEFWQKENPFDVTQGLDYIGLLSQNDTNELKEAIIKEVKKDERVYNVVISKFEIIKNYVNDILIENVKTYVYIKVKMVFDPPTSSALIDAYNAQAKELEWRLYTQEGGY